MSNEQNILDLGSVEMIIKWLTDYEYYLNIINNMWNSFKNKICELNIMDSFKKIMESLENTNMQIGIDRKNDYSSNSNLDLVKPSTSYFDTLRSSTNSHNNYMNELNHRSYMSNLEYRRDTYNYYNNPLSYYNQRNDFYNPISNYNFYRNR